MGRKPKEEKQENKIENETEEKSKEELKIIESMYKEIENLGCRISRKPEDLRPSYFLSTGLFSLDVAISEDGGFPGNVCVEVFGPNSTGKTSLAIQIAAQAQKRGMTAYYINAERAINASLIKCFPELKAESVVWITPDNGEKAINIMTHLLQTKTDSLVINDSIPACLPATLLDGNAEDAQVGALARLFSPFMAKAKKYCEINNNVLIQLNQERAKIGPMARGGTDQPGGNAVKFYSDIRIKLERRFPSPEIKVGGDVIGHYVLAKVVKNRCGIPYKTAELPIIYGKGFDVGRELFTFATMFNVIVKKGAWYSYYEKDIDTDKNDPIFKSQGEDQMAKYIRENPKVREDIENRLKEILL